MQPMKRWVWIVLGCVSALLMAGLVGQSPPAQTEHAAVFTHDAVAADHAEFFFGELAVGVIPDAGAVRLPRMVPPAIAKELILTGGRLTAERAHALGLVNRVVPIVDLMGAARSLAAEICATAPLAVAAVLEVIRETSSLSIQQALEAMRAGEIPAYNQMLDSEDAQEGPAAFSEGREPRWKGR